jgi:hypothetical protein
VLVASVAVAAELLLPLLTTLHTLPLRATIHMSVLLIKHQER